LPAEHRHVAVGPRPEGPPGGQLDVLAALVEALGAHQAPGEEPLVAVGAVAAQQAGRFAGVVRDPEEALFDGYACQVVSVLRWPGPAPPSTGPGACACTACRSGRGGAGR